MNENLRRALLRARLTDEDVAARLEVDPKTVRRWLEGRLPYLRHRWALATLLDIEVTDLWPQMRAGSRRPKEVLAIYPHLVDVPAMVWQVIFSAAQREIDVLTESELLLAPKPKILTALRSTREQVRIRLCLYDPDPKMASAKLLSTALPEPNPNVQRIEAIDFRLHPFPLNNSIYRVDDELLIVHHAFGIRAGQAPVIHLRYIEANGMASTYLESFESIWANALPPSRQETS